MKTRILRLIGIVLLFLFIAFYIFLNDSQTWLSTWLAEIIVTVISAIILFLIFYFDQKNVQKLEKEIKQYEKAEYERNFNEVISFSRASIYNSAGAEHQMANIARIMQGQKPVNRSISDDEIVTIIFELDTSKRAFTCNSTNVFLMKEGIKKPCEFTKMIEKDKITFNIPSTVGEIKQDIVFSINIQGAFSSNDQFEYIDEIIYKAGKNWNFENNRNKKIIRTIKQKN